MLTSTMLNNVNFVPGHFMTLSVVNISEPNHYLDKNAVNNTARDLVRDFATLRSLISKYSLYNDSLLYGPGVTTPVPRSSAVNYLCQ